MSPVPVLAAFLAVSLYVAPARAGDVGAALARVLDHVGTQGYTVRLELTENPRRTIAMSAHFAAGECLVVALENSSYVAEALSALPVQDRGALLEGMMAHEIGHCEERHARLAAVDPAIQAIAAVTAARDVRGRLVLKPVSKLELWGEILADAYMGVYLRRHHPEAAQRIMAMQLARRAANAFVDPAHDTYPALAEETFDSAAGETLLEAATRIRGAGLERMRAKVSEHPSSRRP